MSVFFLLPPLLLLLRFPPCLPVEEPSVKHFTLGADVLDFDGRSKVPTKFVLTCPIPGAIWIVPFDHRPAKRLRSLQVREARGSSQLIISADRPASSGTYSCCDPQRLPDSHRRAVAHVRSQFHCLEGCCPWYRRGCAVDLAERSCLQARLMTARITQSRPIIQSSLSVVENSPILVPCFPWSNQSVAIDTTGDESISNDNLVPGYGYCVDIPNERQEEKMLLRCTYPNSVIHRFFVIFIKETRHINNVIIAIIGKKNASLDLPKVIEVPRNYILELKCYVEKETACLLWKNDTCYSCSNEAKITLKKKIVKPELITCEGSPTAEGSQVRRTSVSIKMIEAPYLHVELDRKEIPIIQHETAPVVSMRVAFSPPNWERSVVAIDSRTSTRYLGTCDTSLLGIPRCNVSLQRPPLEVQYELVVTLSPPGSGSLWPALENRSSVRLIPQFNRPPNITGIPRIGMVGQFYEALCVPDSNPSAVMHWFLDGRPAGGRNASRLPLRATRARRTCVRCEVRHPLLGSVASERCLVRTDVRLRGFEVRLAVTTRRPLFLLLEAPDEGRLEVVEEAELRATCLTFLRPANTSLEVTLDGAPLRNTTDRWTGFSRAVASRLAARNGSLIACRARPGLLTSLPLRVTVRRHQPPRIAALPSRRRVLDAHELRQTCEASGVPLPWVVWRFGGAKEGEVTSELGPNVSQPGRGASELYIRDVNRANSGIYVCEARGAYDTVRARLQLDVNPRVLDYMTVVTVLVVIFIVLVLCFCSIAYLFHKNWRLRKKLFERYRLLLCSPELGDSSNNYADPFDISLWQLRAQDMRLTRERLGQGEFGRVLKGFLNQPDAPSPVPVAVKQLLSDSRVLGVGRSAEEESMNRRKFMEEIQIMSTVGKHANVLQMLGLVIDEETLQISLVCEFCEGGNLVHYLQARQASFVMRPGPSTDPEALCFEDLLRIALDISHGMAHIHSRGILHRDLAARNVLVGADGAAKISDFGLSRNRSEYSGLEYSRRNTNERLPWKWLALECLRDGLFSAKSDIWSYGITLWEIFSLGNRPYPEQYYTTYFIRNLNSGYRLSRPAYASDSIFEVMKSCWLTEQDLRPSFPQIVATVQSVIDRWRAEGVAANARGWPEKRGAPLSNGTAGKALVAQYVNVVGSPMLPAASDECEIKLLDAYVPMSEGSAYTTYSHVF